MDELQPKDVATYLDLLGYETRPEATLATLRDLQLRHTCTFTFETLSTMLHLPVSLQLSSLKSKILYGGRGGYCYELNKLYLALLRELGFRVRGLTGRVTMNGSPDARDPRTHMFLLVEIEGLAYISDVGFGGLVPTTPLRLGSRDVQETPHGPYRISQHDGSYTLWNHVASDWRALHVFDLQSQGEIDFEIGNWYASTHKDSSFVGQLIVARVAEGGRRTLRNGSYALHRIGFESERRQITDVDELVLVLESEFKLRLPQNPEMRPTLTKLIREQMNSF